jgi:hypothetical protein
MVHVNLNAFNGGALAPTSYCYTATTEFLLSIPREAAYRKNILKTQPN